MLIKTKLRKEKLAEARQAFPNGKPWKAEQLARRLKVSAKTMYQWISEWRMQGIVTREETGENLNDKGSSRFRYRFV